MKFSVIKTEHEGEWGGDSEDKEFSTLEELTEFLKQIQKEGDHVYRFIVYDPPVPPYLDYAGFISIAPAED